MRVLITGATGFIGCHTAAKLLDAGHTLRLFVRDAAKLERVFSPFGKSTNDFEVSLGSIADRSAIREALQGCQGLVHCAGLFSPDRQAEELLEATNVEGTRNILEVAASAELERAVYVSSILALFPPSGPTLTANDAVTQPRSMYAATKAAAERIARAAQSGNPESGGPAFPLTIVYPSAVQGPYDPTFSIGPQLVAAALISGKVLVTEGGLPSTDVRDLAALIERIFAGETTAPRLMAPSFFVPHEAYHALLEKLSGRTLEAQRSPGWLLRILGRLGDVAARLGRNVQLTHEAAEVLTRSVPVDDQETRALLGRPAISVEQSFSDLITWMLDAGHLAREHAPKSAQPPASSAT